MEFSILYVFFFVYTGMFLGEIPGLALDRTGVALIGAITIVLAGALDPLQAWNAVDVPTIALLFGLMVVSAQFRLGGFYTVVTRKMAALPLPPQGFLFLLIFMAGLLSALLANDIVCLAMTPILIEGCAKRRYHPLPFLLALACASNIGSAATLIGNPQNMLIGQRLQLSFGAYLADGLVPAILGLLVTWGIIAVRYRGRWHHEMAIPTVEAPPFNIWQSTKGLIILFVLVFAFLFVPLPREALALAAAGILLLSRKMASREMLGLVDWQILVLFISLFIVNHAMEQSGLIQRGLQALGEGGVDVSHPAWLFTTTALLSNLVSNVPAVMLLLPAAVHPMAGPILALSSTLAGNLILVGSIANLIVTGKASEFGIAIHWREHAQIGVPVTLITLLISAGWLWVQHTGLF